VLHRAEETHLIILNFKNMVSRFTSYFNRKHRYFINRDLNEIHEAYSKLQGLTFVRSSQPC